MNAKRKVNADLKVAGKILGDFNGSHYLSGATDLKEALLILDGLIHNMALRQAEILTPQIDGLKDTFEVSQAFSSIRVVLNGLEQSEGADADYVVIDSTHIRFYRPLNQNETLRTDYLLAQHN